VSTDHELDRQGIATSSQVEGAKRRTTVDNHRLTDFVYTRFVWFLMRISLVTAYGLTAADLTNVSNVGHCQARSQDEPSE